MFGLNREHVREVATAVGPLVGVVCVLQFAFVGASALLFFEFLLGALLAAVGMLLLFSGIELGILPMGRFVGAELPRKGSVALILGVAFALGFATTVAEPDVLILAQQVSRLSEGAMPSRTLSWIIAAGVGVCVALALLRVVRNFRMTWLLFGLYALMIVLSFVTPDRLVPLAYDAGSVTTGVLTAPVILALALGVSSVLANRSSVSDGFGLLGIASIGPIIAIQIFGILFG